MGVKQIFLHSAQKHFKSDIKGIRENRKREQIKTHIDYTKEGSVNE